MSALAHAVHQGKAIYAGISNYSAQQTSRAIQILKKMGVRCLIHQPKYSMFERTPEKGLLDVLEKEGVGGIAFSPLAQGLLTDKYLKGIPADSRAAKEHGFLKREAITKQLVEKIKSLNEIASSRGQSLAQMALAWVLRDKRITSVLVGASSCEQIKENVAAVDKCDFSNDELKQIDRILG